MIFCYRMNLHGLTSYIGMLCPSRPLPHKKNGQRILCLCPNMFDFDAVYDVRMQIFFDLLHFPIQTGWRKVQKETIPAVNRNRFLCPYLTPLASCAFTRSTICFAVGRSREAYSKSFPFFSSLGVALCSRFPFSSYKFSICVAE